jgi:hypothetical protein
MNITVFKSLTNTSTPIIRDVSVAIERIKTGKTKDLIAQIRKEKDKGKRNELKSKLPSYCFGGEFSYRSVQGLVKPSGLLCIDFDNFNTLEEVIEFKETLKEVPYTYICFVSPSERGVKALFKIPIIENVEDYNAYFDAIAKFFSHPNWDSNNNGIGRVCYESYDADIYVNKDSIEWTNKEIEELEELGCDTAIIPVTSENRIITNLLTWFNSKYQMVDGQRNNNLIKLGFALNDFGINKREAESVMLQYESKDFKASEIKTIVDSAYRRTQNFGTKFFEDNEEKARIEKMVKSGKKEDDIIREFSSFDRGQIKKVISNVKDVITVDNFWTFTNNGAVKISPHKYKVWLESNGFFKYFPDGGGYSFVRKEQNLLSVTDQVKIKDFVLEYLLNNEGIGYLPYDYMAASSKHFNADFLTFLKTEDVSLMKDTKDECYLYFANGVAKITKSKIELIDYIDIPSLVWKNQIIDREYKKTKEKGDFEKFVHLLAGGDDDKFESIKTVIGYLCHNYNNGGNMKAIIVNDEGISENPDGGSGKSLLGSAIGKVRRLSIIDGKLYKADDKFRFQTVEADTQVTLFDDVLRNFEFEMLFSVVTQGMTIEYKNKPAIKLTPEETSKILITTNYTIGGVGGSFERRKHEIEVSGYFNHLHTPYDEFGKMFFDEWDSLEWIKFDNFMISCVQLFLEKGLIKHDFKNLEVRKFIKETSYEFYEWVNDDEMNLPLNTRVDKAGAYESIINDYPDLRKWLKQKRFNAWINSYAKMKGLRLFTGKSNNVRWFELEDLNAPKESIDSIAEETTPF